MDASTVLFDVDGDRIDVNLIGPGRFQAVQNDPDGDLFGSLAALNLRGTTSKSVLSIKVTKFAIGDGAVNLGSLNLPSPLGGILAPAVNLTGTGLTAGDSVRAITLKSIANGADVSVGGPATSLLAFSVGSVSAGSDISTAGALAGNFGLVEAATWTAASFGQITAAGDFNANLVSTATTAALGKTPALASLAVNGGNLTGDITGQGVLGPLSVKAVKTKGGAILGSTITGSGLASLTSSGKIDATLALSGAVGAITAGGDASGAWTATSFGALKVTGGNLSTTIASTATAAALGKTIAIAGATVTGGDFTGDLFALGNVGNITVVANKTAGGNVTGSTFTAASFGNVIIAKNLSDSLLLAGANLGADRALGGMATNGDSFTAGKIGGITVGGAVVKTVIGAGLSPVDTEFKDGNDQLIGTANSACIKSIAVMGTLDNESLIGAFVLPAKVKIGSGSIRPIVDARFLSNASIGAGFLTFKLVTDTGLYAADAVSKEVAVAAKLVLPDGATGFRAAIGNGPLQTLKVTPNATGNFTIPTATLATLNGGSLTDGSYTLRVEVREKGGAVLETSFAFRLDSSAPTVTTLGLSVASDTGAPGDGSTSASVVTLGGSTEAGARITVGSQIALADNNGTFVLPNITLADGVNALECGIIDVAGNTATVNATFTKTAPLGGTDVVLEWNAVNLEAVRLDASPPPVASRGLAMTSIAMFDVVSAFDGTAGYYTRVAAPANASQEAGIAAAAHRVLSYLYPGQETVLNAALATTLSRIADGAGESAGVAFGNSIADTIIAIRSGDGFDKFVNYIPGTFPGEWQQTAPMYDVALLPQWATLTPFALTSASQFRPDGPPALNSTAYATAFNEVKNLGSAISTTRTAEQTRIARFWADGAGTITPPGHWNDIATDLARAKGNSTAANVRLLAELNVALADASIAAWDAKYIYASWRPITAIQQGETDGNAATTEDDAWQPLLITPPFPEYVSGHSTYSGAAASVLTNFFGANQSFTSDSPGLPGVTRSFNSFDAAAQEAGQSRIYGGIHFQFGNQDGLVTGKKIGDLVHARFSPSRDTSAPLIMLNGLEDGDVFAASPAISGYILDNLSGVLNATATFDKAPPVALTLDATGKFTVSPRMLAHGPHTLVINAIDAVGNTASPFTVRFTIDALDPIISVTSLADNASLTVESRLTGQVDGTGSPIVSLCYTFDGGELLPLLYDTVTGAFDIVPDLSALAPGEHVLTFDSLDAAGHRVVKTMNVTLDSRIAFSVTTYTPSSFDSEVGSTFRPQVFFSRPVDPASLTVANFYATDTTGSVIPSTIVPAANGTFAWLFFPNPMPGASTVTIHLVGDTIKAAADQQPLDGDDDGIAGGTLTYNFSTVSLTPLPRTSLSGKVIDPGVDFKPITFDDFRVGPDGIPHTADDIFLNPIAGVKVFIVGLESTVFTTTDAQGHFTLPSVPGGNVKLAVDGRTATNVPAGVYFPEMVMDLNIVPGTANTVMDSMGEPADKIANAGRPEVYLPRLQNSILQTVRAVGNTMVGVDAKSAPNLTDAQRQFLELEVQPGVVLDANGQPLANPQIGISTVPPELVRDMLPSGVLQHTFDITIQAPDAATFAQPLQLTFPNVFNATPGTKLNFLSFDHTTGRLVIEGTATVSADGLSVTTDPSSGITKPGWHGLTPPGSEGRGCEPEVLTWNRMVDVAQTVATCLAGVAGKLSGEISAIVDLVNTSTDLVQEILDVKTKAKDGASVSDTCLLVATLEPAVQSFVKRVSIALEDIFVPLAEAKAAVQCAKAILGNLSSLCKDVLRIEECQSIYIDVTCVGIEAAKRAVEVVSAAMGQLQGLIAGISAAGVELIFLELKNAYCPPLLAAVRSDVSRQNALPDASQLVLFDRLSLAITNIQTALGPARDVRESLPDMDVKVSRTLADTEFLKESLVKQGGSFFLIEGSDFSLRGVVRETGGLRAFLPADKELRFTLYDPVSNRVARETLVTASSGQRTTLPVFAFLPTSGMEDSDGDRLVDLAERVVGTNRERADSDGDGLSDFAEIRSGASPVGGRPIAIGVLGTIALTGEALAVASVSVDGTNPLTFIATGSYGLAIVATATSGMPTLVSEFNLAGTAKDVAVEAAQSLAVVASGSGGLHILDVSNPRLPTLMYSVPINATFVEVRAGIAYANDGTVIRAYGLDTGDLFQTISVGSDAVTGLAIEGDHLYVMDAANHLTAFDLSGPSMVKQGTLTTPVGGGQLTVGNGVVYIAAEANGGGFTTGGFATVDVSNRNAPVLISGVDANNLAGHAIALNGSGLAVAVGSPADLGNLVHLVNVRDTANTASLVTQFTLPADPQGVTIANGLAYIADGTGGLVVVNYLSADIAGVAPTATLSSTVGDADRIAPGVQVQASSLLPINLTVADDVQVASVELLKDGVIIGMDTSFPFEFGAIAAGVTSGGKTTLQIRVTDTGGNAGLSNTLTFDIVADSTAPTLIGSNPSEGGTRSGSLQTVRLFFSEALNENDLIADHFTLTGPGGTTVPVKSVTASQQGRQVSVVFDPLIAGVYTLRLDAPNLHDLSGNALGTIPLDRHFNVVTATKVFINADGGDWNSPANWESGTLPAESDIVALPLNPGKAVTISSGNIKVGGIITDDTLQITGGSLTLTGVSDISGVLKVSNGADLIVDGVNASLTAQNPLLDGGDLISIRGGDFHFPTLQFFQFGSVTVESPGGEFDAPALRNVDGSSFLARGGVTLTLPAVTSYSQSLTSQSLATLRAEGPGSVLDLRNLLGVTNGQLYAQRINIEAFNGGKIDLRNVTSILDPSSGDQRYRNIAVKSDGTGSTIDLSSLSSFVDNYAGSTGGENFYSELKPANGGTITAPNLTSVRGVWTILESPGSVATNQWANFNGSRLELKTAGYSFAGMQTAAGAELLVSGSTTTANFNALTNIDGANLLVSSGVTLTLPAVTSYSQSLTSQSLATLRAEGPGSVLDLRNLLGVTNGQLYAQRINIEALNGGRIDLRNVTSILDPNSGDQRYRNIDVRADGVGSEIYLPALLSFVDNYAGSTTGENVSSAIRKFNQGTILVPGALVTVGVIVSV